MVSLNSVGLAGVTELAPPGAAADPRPPQRLGHAEPPPSLGMVLAAYQKLWRLAGVDQMHVNGLAQQVLGGRRLRDRLRAVVPDADVRGKPDPCRSSRPASGRRRRRKPTPRLGTADLIYAAAAGSWPTRRARGRGRQHPPGMGGRDRRRRRGRAGALPAGARRRAGRLPQMTERNRPMPSTVAQWNIFELEAAGPAAATRSST